MSIEETFGRTIQLFLVDGRPNGLRRTTIHGWTGVVFVSADSTFEQLIGREEVDRTGIYFLAGPDPEREAATRVYVGSGNSVSERVKQSSQKRDFWEMAVTVTTSDDDLSKGHAEYLEARIIDLADRAGRVILDNGTSPDVSRRRLPEADIANMEQFLSNLKIVLPVIGLDVLKPPPKRVITTENSHRENDDDRIVFEIRHRSGLFAEATEIDGEFVVFEGSEALVAEPEIPFSYRPLQNALIDSGVLVSFFENEKNEDRLKFSKIYSFSSPSAAAAVILARNSNGRREWKVRNSKETYADWKISHSKASIANR